MITFTENEKHEIDFWNNLPDEIWQYIFDFIAREDLHTVKQVCQKFCNLIIDEKFKKKYLQRVFKQEFKETIFQQAVRLQREALNAVAENQEEIDKKIEAAEVDEYIDILVEQFKQEDQIATPGNDEYAVTKGINYYKQIQQTAVAIESANHGVRKTPGFCYAGGCAAFILAVCVFASGTWFLLSETNAGSKEAINKNGVIAIDIAFSVSVALYFLFLFGAVINRCCNKRLEEQKTQIKTLDEKSPLLGIENSPFWKNKKTNEETNLIINDDEIESAQAQNTEQITIVANHDVEKQNDQSEDEEQVTIATSQV